MGAGRQPTWAVLKAHFCASPRKTALLSFLFVVMVVVYVRMFAGGPSQAADAESIVPTWVPPTATSTSVSAKPERNVLERVELTEPLTRELARDPFVASVGMGSTSEALADGSGWLAAGAGSVTGELELQSTICCDQPMAVINGRFLQPGDAIGGFILERVEPTRVWLRRNGVHMELKLR